MLLSPIIILITAGKVLFLFSLFRDNNQMPDGFRSEPNFAIILQNTQLSTVNKTKRN